MHKHVMVRQGLRPTTCASGALPMRSFEPLILKALDDVPWLPHQLVRPDADAQHIEDIRGDSKGDL